MGKDNSGSRDSDSAAFHCRSMQLLFCAVCLCMYKCALETYAVKTLGFVLVSWASEELSQWEWQAAPPLPKIGCWIIWLLRVITLLW